ALSSGNWTLERPAGSPSARLGPSLAYDPAANTAVLFGGSVDFGSATSGETWVYRAGNWTQIFPSLSPSPRWGAMLVYDPNESALVLFGGTDGSTAFHDTWEFKNGTWSQLTLAVHPSGRAWASAAFDGSNGAVVLFGGCQGVYGGFYGCSGQYANDTWTFSNGSWSALSPLVTPPGSAGAAMASSPLSSTIPMYGAGSGTGTWLFADGDWSVLQLPLVPGTREFTTMVYDPTAKAFWFIGGNGNPSSNLWELIPPDTLQVGVPTVNQSVADLGQTVSLAVSVQGASGSVSYSWSGLPGCPSVNASLFSCTVGSTGSFSVQVAVDTTEGPSVTSAVVSLTVNPDPIVGTPSAYPTSLYLGGLLSLSVSASGGTAPLAYAWTGLPGGCSSPDAASFSCTPGAGGSDTIAVEVTDSVGFSALSPSVAVIVEVVPSLSSPTPSRTSVDVGQPITFATTISGSAGTDSVSWSGLPTECPSPNASVVTCTPTAPLQLSVSVQLSYATGLSVTSLPTPFEVFADPSVTVPRASLPSAVAGQTVTFSISSTPGSGSEVFVWHGLPSACADLVGPASTSVACAVPEGNYSISVSVTDSNGFEADGPSLSYNVSAAPGPGRTLPP
ncbi:MAG TPA: kelch repeat-containing protein, partial [Thermoplasmata archaeon]